MAVKMKMKKIYQTKNPRYGVRMSNKPKGIMVHEIACNQPNPMVFVKRWNDSDISKAVHAFVGRGVVIETLPCDPGKVSSGWHAGGSANRTHISFEMCEYEGVDWVKPWLPKVDKKHQKEFEDFTIDVYETAVQYAAYKCKQFGWSVNGSSVISHKEGNAKGIASAHGDPDEIWKLVKSRKLTMDGFRADVKKAMKGKNPIKPAPKNLATSNSIKGESNRDRFVRTFKAHLNSDYGTQFTNTPEYTKEMQEVIKKHNIKKGSPKHVTKHIQFWLNKMGYKGKDGKELSIDGDFGNNTEYATKKLQKDLKLTADGIIGTGTVSAIIKKLN